MVDMCRVCIVRTYYIIWICTTWVQRSTRRFGDTRARLAVWYVRTHDTHLSGSYRSRSDIIDMPRNPDIPLECELDFYPLFFLLVSVGHRDPFVGYRVVIDRVCTRALSHLTPHSTLVLLYFLLHCCCWSNGCAYVRTGLLVPFC